MPHLSGVFENFKNLDQIPTQDLTSWLKVKIEPHILENAVGNRILYPQLVSVTAQDLEIDLALLREAVKRSPEVIYDSNKARLNLSEVFLNRFGTNTVLIKALMDVLDLAENVQIYQKTQNSEVLGAIITPKRSVATSRLTLTINSKAYSINIGQVLRIPYFSKKAVQIEFDPEHTFQVYGGKEGIWINLRKVTKL